MKLLSGIFDNCLLQRNKINKSEQEFEGECKSTGTVFAEVSGKCAEKTFFKNLKTGKAYGGHFKGILKGLPAGGPYDINFLIAAKNGQVLESLKVKDVLVGDLWLLAGQSNMQGVGRLKDRSKPDKNVRAYYMNNKWGIAEDPIHNLWNAVAPVHGGNPDLKVEVSYYGTGPGVAFGQAMFKALKVPQGLIACAHGGTSMTQWNPELKKDGDNSLYGAAINRLKRLGGKISGLVWYQGCSDANTIEDVNAYTERMKNLVNAFRYDAGNPNLPFVIVQLGRYIYEKNIGAFWSGIREQQYELPSKIKNLLMVPAIDMDLDDPIHLSGKSQNRLGARIADAALCFYEKKRLKPLECESITARLLGYNQVLELKIKNVAGKLSSDGVPRGFEFVRRSEDSVFTAADGWVNPYSQKNILPEEVKIMPPFKVEIEEDRIILYPYLEYDALGEYDLVYGRGLNPCCNIRDSESRPLPAFRMHLPIPYGPLSEFASIMEVSELPVYVKETDKNISYRSNIKFIKVSGGPSIKHPKRAELATSEDKVFYFRTFLDVPADAVIIFGLGYDGPVRVFADGKDIFNDMKGSNPIGRDKVFIEHRFTKGIHELMIAEGSNKGMAYGISLRMRLTEYPDGVKFPSFVLK